MTDRVTRYHELIAKYEQTRSRRWKTRYMRKLSALYRHMTREERAVVDGKENS